MREIKYRIWIPSLKRMSSVFGICWQDGRIQAEFFIDEKETDTSNSANFRFLYADNGECHLMQFVNKLGFNKKELYEGDIVFCEDQTDDGDERHYLIVVWIPEWCMFASLLLDEYNKFVTDGVEALDECMFWTFTLEGSDDYHYAGNIYENPELLK